jgi:hypothetical protein
MKTTHLLLGLLITFIIILCQLFIPAFENLLGGPVFLFPFLVFSTLGIVLIIKSHKKTKGNVRKFLLLTGLCSSGVFVGIVLHNMFYALAILTEHMFLLPKMFEFFHAVFFIFSLVACPMGFVFGIIKSFSILKKQSFNK